MDDLGGKIEMVVDGGPCQIGVESTVVDITCSPPVILRPGAISKENLEKVMGKVDLFQVECAETSVSPGLMK
jgi:L-threonylcarbamoyladenylate synthase